MREQKWIWIHQIPEMKVQLVRTEVQSSENPKSGVLENRSTDFWKSDAIKTDKKDIDFNDTDLINLSGEKTGKKQKVEQDAVDRMDKIKAYTKIIKENIDYNALTAGCSMRNKEYVDEMVELLTETVSIERDTVCIAGAEYPFQMVKGKLLKLNYEHIQYVLECLHKNTTKVRNIRAYLLACLFNAPSTINSYYWTEVNRDMYGGVTWEGIENIVESTDEMLKTEYGGDVLENQIISAELMELGNRVRKYRNERHWSQKKLAEKVDVSLNTVSRIEGGQTRMSIEIFMRFVQVLGVDAELLLFGVFPNNRDETEYARIQLMIQ